MVVGRGGLGGLCSPEVVAARRQDDPVRREALPLHDEGDVTVLLAEHERSQLLRQQVDVVDLRHGGQRPQGVAVAHDLPASRTLARMLAQRRNRRE